MTAVRRSDRGARTHSADLKVELNLDDEKEKRIGQPLDVRGRLSFAVTAPFTHNGLGSSLFPCPNRTACSGVNQHTQIEMLKQRLDGFVSIDAD